MAIHSLILTIHFVACILLVVVILLQVGKDAGFAFGQSSQSVFGNRGASGFLTKLTSITATVFLMTSLALSFSANKKKDSVIEEEQALTLTESQKSSESQKSAESAPMAESQAQTVE